MRGPRQLQGGSGSALPSVSSFHLSVPQGRQIFVSGHAHTASSHQSSMMEPYAKTAASLNLEVKGLTKTCRCSLLCLAKELPVRILEVGLNKRKHQVNACVPDNLTVGQGADRTLSANSSKRGACATSARQVPWVERDVTGHASSFV